MSFQAWTQRSDVTSHVYKPVPKARQKIQWTDVHVTGPASIGQPAMQHPPPPQSQLRAKENCQLKFTFEFGRLVPKSEFGIYQNKNIERTSN